MAVAVAGAVAALREDRISSADRSKRPPEVGVGRGCDVGVVPAPPPVPPTLRVAADLTASATRPSKEDSGTAAAVVVAVLLLLLPPSPNTLIMSAREATPPRPCPFPDIPPPCLRCC